MDVTEKFDASKYLTNISGRPYLEVKWRLLWFREENPNGDIDTDLLYHDPVKGIAIVKATVTMESGGKSSDLGSEESSDFGDYIEKAATKAIGRALGSLGYGTQFTDDHEFGAANGRVVDSPVGPHPGNYGTGYNNGGRTGQYGDKPRAAVIMNESGVRMPTPNQIGYIKKLAREQGIDDVDTDGMTFNDASKLIEELQAATTTTR